MELKLNEEQELLKATAREVLERECPLDQVLAQEADPQGYSTALWRRLAELGWLGTPFPETLGGAGYSFLELCLLIEELGRARVAGPFLSTVALGGMAVACFGSEAQQSEYVPAIAAGDCRVAYAPGEPRREAVVAGTGLSLGRDGDSFVLDGAVWFVADAHVADRLLVVASLGTPDGPGEEGAQGRTLLLVDAASRGIEMNALDALGAERQHRVQFREVRVPAGDVLGRPRDGDAAAALLEQWGGAATCAAMVGGAQRVLELSSEYATQRMQFGRPIGSFQAIQHHCANMAVDVATSRLMAYEAAWRLSAGLEAAAEVSAAKAWVSDAYARVCALGHQVHGAIGFTHEHPLRLFSQHAAGAALAFGDADHHREQVCRSLGI